jgi:predicted phage tail protein
VPDGKGETEPRFRANIYLTKATDCYKVLKDMATTFRSILYWSEGNIVPVVDQDKDPVYNFTKGNVIDGEFNYEGTGSKLRSNQVVVTWNNPENDYVPEALLVEDKQNIVKTGKIISENAVAFGATSIGQATRYGRWKLWTAINQSEVVSFGTAINAAFIAPGDIVNVQDADRYDIIYSGRVSNTGTPSTTSIPLDRATILNSGSTYKLSVLIESSVPFLAQDSATIGGTAYTRGDIIPGFTTEEAASNIQDSNNVLVQINWAPYTHVETQDVSTSAGTVTSLTVDTAFTVAPNAETIWALQEHVTASNLDSAASKKMYKILSIKEAKKGIYDITAVEHYNEKFNDIDVDFGLPYVETLLTPSQFVPAPTNLSSEIL